MVCLRLLSALALLPAIINASPTNFKVTQRDSKAKLEHHKVVILGGGVAGIIAARTLHRAGIDDFIIVEARHELGGRMMSTVLPDSNITVELGANWVEGLGSDTGLQNPIYELALKHNVSLVYNDWDDLNYYDQDGDAEDRFTTNNVSRCDVADDAYSTMIAGAGARIENNQVDLTCRSGYQLTGERFVLNQYDKACEYDFDWEWGQTPEQSSWIATSHAYNATFDPDEGFGDDDLFCVDQRGFKTLILQEAAEFLKPSQVYLNSTVKTIKYDERGVTVRLEGGKSITANHVLATFSVGVLQNDDVKFEPALPDWKQEAIQTMKMSTYTKIFLKFPYQFWDDAEMGLYADPYTRGYYPVWQNLNLEKFFPGSNLYFVTVTGDQSERVESMPDHVIQAEMMAVLQNMYPNITIPEPDYILLHRWHADPLFRGTWANWPSGFVTNHMLNLKASVKGHLHFAGEGTSLEYYGYLHGAYFEGLARGTAIAECIKGNCTAVTNGSDFEQTDLLPYPIVVPDE